MVSYFQGRRRIGRKIFGPSIADVAKEWRKLHEEFQHLYFSPVTVKVI